MDTVMTSQHRLFCLLTIVPATLLACAASGDSEDGSPPPDAGQPDGNVDAGRDGFVDGTPTPPGKVVQIAVTNAGNACALLETGAMYCWGRKVGGGVDTMDLQPVAIPGLSNVKQMAVGGLHACVINGQSHVLCWGVNGMGQLGTGDLESRAEPTDIGLSDIIRISADDEHTCAVRNDGKVLCWGVNNTLQSYPDYEWAQKPENVYVRRPMIVPDVEGAIHVSAGAATCALGTDGTITCWGRAVTASGYKPAKVPELESAREVAAGNVSVARLADGSAVKWGWSTSKPEESVPVPRSSGPVSQVATAGYWTSALVTPDGKIDFLRDGEEATGGQPLLETEDFAALADVVAISLTTHVACVLKKTNIVECAGINDLGQLGDGTRRARRVFAPVMWKGPPPR